MTDATRTLIAPHYSRRLIIDTNLLLLLLVGDSGPQQIQQFKRTKMYSLPDYETTAELATEFARRNGVFTTPHILTEVSNLTGQLHGSFLLTVRRRLSMFIDKNKEHHSPASQLAGTENFLKFGITDAGVIALASAEYLVLTDDLQLAVRLQSLNKHVINFNHLKFPS